MISTTINHKPASKIVLDTADMLIDFYAGQAAVDHNEVFAAIQGVYASRKRVPTFNSSCNVIRIMERRGVVQNIEGESPNHTITFDFTVVI